MMKLRVAALIACMFSVTSSSAPKPDPLQQQSYERFARGLWRLAESNGVPGLSAAIVHARQLAWTDGFGFADIENGVPATQKTLYRLASVSKPFAAVLLMQLVDEGRLDLDAPMRNFRIHPWFSADAGSWAHFPTRYEEKPITVRHVLTHTSEGEPPGSSYSYSGNIFGDLTWVIEDVLKAPYPDALKRRVFEIAGMDRTLPGQLAPDLEGLLQALAGPYKVEEGKPIRASYPGFGLPADLDSEGLGLEPAYRLPPETDAARRELLGEAYTPLYSVNSAAGIVSSVEDLARFDIAFDRGLLVSAGSRRAMFEAAVAPDGTVLPYGLGWFVEEERGVKIIWHYGWYPPTVSALYIKVPERQISFILLAVSDLLSAGYSWTRLGVRASPYANLFLQHFVFADSANR